MKYSSYLIALGLFVGVIVTLGFCFPGWWFWYNDEFIYLSSGAYAKTWSDLFYFFIDGDTHRYHEAAQSFAGTFYRPINCIIATLEYWCFGTNAFYYHITDVIIHALNTVLIFLMAQGITSLFPALWGALMFAFHPLVAYEFGRVDCLHMYVSTTYILLCLMLLQIVLNGFRGNARNDKRSSMYYILLCIVFAFSLINRETTAILPLLFTLASFCFHNKKTFSFKPFITPWLILAGFTALRFSLLPIHATRTFTLPSLQKIIATLTLWAQFLLQATYDFFALSWLPGGYPITRAIILCACLGLCLYTVSCHPGGRVQRGNPGSISISPLALLLFSAYALLWPSFVLGGYCMRYNYEAQPFMIFFLLGCWVALSGKKHLRIVIGSCAWGLILFNMVLCIWCFAQREQRFIDVKQSFEEFCDNPALIDRNLCFVRTPGRPFGNGIGKALNVFCGIPETRVYYDEASCVHAPYLVNKGFVRVPYFIKGVPPSPQNKKLDLPQDVLDTNPLFITWDFTTSGFVIT